MQWQGEAGLGDTQYRLTRLIQHHLGHKNSLSRHRMHSLEIPARHGPGQELLSKSRSCWRGFTVGEEEGNGTYQAGEMREVSPRGLAG